LGAALVVAGYTLATAGLGAAAIGRYGYVEVAEQMGARYFSVPTSVWDSMTRVQQWEMNKAFLDDMIAQGTRFYLASPLSKAVPPSFFAEEVKYLIEKGYSVSADGQWLVPLNPWG
jgi:hypothetical protein